MTRLASVFLQVSLTYLAFAQSSLAGWKDDTGWAQLAAELAAAMPTGSGVPVLQAEANSVSSPPNYLVQGGGPGTIQGSGAYAGKTFLPQSGAGTTFGHAASVASYFFANGSGAAPGVTQIHAFTAIDYAVNRLLAGAAPAVLPGRVHNHSWVGSFNQPDADVAATRRLDYMIARDKTLVVVGLNNNSAMPGLLGNNYHGMTVGMRSGSHSMGGSNRDGNGRMKPDLVVKISSNPAVDLTSYATPVVSGFAAMLLQEALASTDPDADRPEVIKALLLAGAAKDALPAWRRLTNSKPYDEKLGAGEANIRNAWRIQQAGRALSLVESEVPIVGWAYQTWSGDSQWFFFSVPSGGFARTFSAALTWHRDINLGEDTASLSNLDLRLHAAEDFAPVGDPVAVSASAIDNVEHLFLRHLPPGQYALEVSGAGQAAPYALAWQSEPGTGPRVSLRQGNETDWFLDAMDVDPWVTYVIESRLLGNLESAWESHTTFRTADATPARSFSWQISPAPEPGRVYHLRWTTVR